MKPERNNHPEMGRKGQKSIRQFTDEERELVVAAMRIDAIDSESQWIARAAIMWARQIIAEDAGLLEKINANVKTRKPERD